MSDAFICLLGWIIGLGFILLFLVAWKVAFPSGEPGIIERGKAALKLYQEATYPGEKITAVCLGFLIMIKGIKGVLIGFFTFVLSAISASICGYDPFQLIERLIDFGERLLFGPNEPSPSSTKAG